VAAAEAKRQVHPVAGLVGMLVAWMIFSDPADTPAGIEGVRVDYIGMVAAQACLRLLGDYRLAGLAYKHTHLRLVLAVRLGSDSEGRG
jgi:hypothetical protein